MGHDAFRINLTRGTWRASCMCGWLGDAFFQLLNAQAQLDGHLSAQRGARPVRACAADRPRWQPGRSRRLEALQARQRASA